MNAPGLGRHGLRELADAAPKRDARVPEIRIMDEVDYQSH